MNYFTDYNETFYILTCHSVTLILSMTTLITSETLKHVHMDLQSGIWE